MHIITSQRITLLHVSTLFYHPQRSCNQYFAKLHNYFNCSCWHIQIRLFEKFRRRYIL